MGFHMAFPHLSVRFPGLLSRQEEIGLLAGRKLPVPPRPATPPEVVVSLRAKRGSKQSMGFQMGFNDQHGGFKSTRWRI
jgi:hypothetical protein